jgi:hypothetical protein
MARAVTQMRPCGIVLSTSVQAEMQGPSIITRWPDWRTVANMRRNEPTSPPGLDTMRKSARAASAEMRNITRVMMARGTRALPRVCGRSGLISVLTSSAPMNIDAKDLEKLARSPGRFEDNRAELFGCRSSSVAPGELGALRTLPRLPKSGHLSDGLLDCGLMLAASYLPIFRYRVPSDSARSAVRCWKAFSPAQDGSRLVVIIGF